MKILKRNTSAKNKIQKLQFKTKELEKGWFVKFLKFPNKGKLVSIIIYGIIANVSPSTKGGREKLQHWKRKIAMEIQSKHGNISFNPNNQCCISVGMRFHTPTHGNQKLDLDNFIKPIVDGIAAGLFSDDKEDLSHLTKYNQFDDSNFRYLYMERLPDALEEQQEGISVVISKM